MESLKTLDFIERIKDKLALQADYLLVTEGKVDNNKLLDFVLNQAEARFIKLIDFNRDIRVDL